MVFRTSRTFELLSGPVTEKQPLVTGAVSFCLNQVVDCLLLETKGTAISTSPLSQMSVAMLHGVRCMPNFSMADFCCCSRHMSTLELR